MEKKCLKCKQVKNISCFNKSMSRKDKMQIYCTDCLLQYNRSLDAHFRRCFIQSTRRAKLTNREHTLTWEEWVTLKPKYSEIHINWAANNYQPKMTPTIDRINNSKGYYYENVQVLTYGENSSKDKRGGDCKRSKLKDYEVLAIRAIGKANKTITKKKLGEMFGVSGDTIKKILNYTSWKYI